MHPNPFVTHDDPHFLHNLSVSNDLGAAVQNELLEKQNYGVLTLPIP